LDIIDYRDNPFTTLEDAVLFRNKIKQENRKFVLTNGCFDLLHSGHVHSLLEASKHGDCLWVALNSDISINCLKGDSRPIIPQKDRAFLLKSLSCVSGVTLFDTMRLDQEILFLKPDIYVKAGDYDETTIAKEERVALRKVNAEIKFVSYLPGKSTSNLIRDITSKSAKS
jgi:rfaE bifunctional protein nucleotidyltransferase chain/domain